MELDAIEPRQLRALVEDAIKRHMPPKKYKELMAVEEHEQEQIRKFVDDLDMDED